MRCCYCMGNGQHRYLVRDSARRAFKNTDPALTPEEAPHAVNVRSDVLKIEVVGADDGNAGYREPPYGDRMRR